MNPVTVRQLLRSPFLSTFLILLPLVLLWSLSNPMFASPDEPAHLLRSQGFSNLDFSPPYQTDGIPVGEIDCLRFNADITADCMSLTWDEPWVQGGSSTEGYPPLLHSLAALPSVVFDGLFATYVTRIWLAVINVALLSWATAMSIRRGTWALTGLMLGITPTVAFTMGTVNPSGLSAAGAALLVVGITSHNRSGNQVIKHLAPMWVGAAVLVLTRRDGALWAALIAAVSYLACSSPRQLMHRWLSSSKTRRTGLAATLVVVVSSAWVVPWILRFINRRATAERSTWQAIRALRIYVDHLIGTFGWLDSTMGIEAFLIAIAAIGFFLMLGFACAQRKERWSLATTFMLLVLVPVVFGSIRYPYFQGRYLIPLWIAFTSIAGHSLQQSSEGLSKIGIRPRPLLLLWSVIHIWSLVNNLKRYVTGRNGPWNIFDSDLWHPPMMSNTVTVTLFALSGCLLVAAAVRVSRGVTVRPLQVAAARGDERSSNLRQD